MNRRTKFGLVFLLSLSLLQVLPFAFMVVIVLIFLSAFVGVIMKIVYIRVLADRGDYTCKY